MLSRFLLSYLHNLVEDVWGVYIIDRESGLVLVEQSKIKEDPMLVGGLIHAVSTFLRNALGSKGNLRTIDSGDMKLILEHGDKYTAIAIAKRDDPITRKKLHILLKAIAGKLYLKPDVRAITDERDMKALISKVFKIRESIISNSA